MIDSRDALAHAAAAARLAGGIIMAGLDGELRVSDKGSDNNLVTHIDTACEEAVRGYLSGRFPDHEFMGEESDYQSRGGEYLWIVDPLDGTTNFIKGIRFFSVSVALAHLPSRRVLAGVVYNPASGELFKAAAGGGAWLEAPGRADAPLRPSARTGLDGSLFVTGFYYDRGAAMRRTLEQIGALLEAGAMDIRRFGSAALDLCHVAAGRVEGFWEHRLNPWDFAAAWLICQEAGATVSDGSGGPLGFEPAMVVAAPPAIHPVLLSYLR